MTLTEINNSFEADKQTDKGKHGYLDIYERYFQSAKDIELTLLEIGIWSGSSLRLYEKYFSKAKIIGIDKSQDCLNSCLNSYLIPRSDVYKVDQSNPEDLIEFSKNKSFDIIIDDGSHYPLDQILSFKILFERLNSGGVYIVEDLHVGYQKAFKGCRGWAVAFFTNLSHDLNYYGTVPFVGGQPNYDKSLSPYVGRFEFIHFYPGLCIIKKN